MSKPDLSIFSRYKFVLIGVSGIALTFAAAMVLMGGGSDAPKIETHRIPLSDIQATNNSGQNNVLGTNTSKKPTSSPVANANNGQNNQSSSNQDNPNNQASDQNSQNNQNNSNNGNNYKVSLDDFDKYIANKKKQAILAANKIDEYRNGIKNSIANGKYNNTFSQAFITPDAGGTLTAGNITVTFPAGAVDEPIIATFRGQDTSSKVQGQGYQLTAENIYGDSVTHFNKDLTIQTILTSNETQSSNESSFATYFYNTQTHAWEKVQSIVNNNTIIAYSNHFTYFTTDDFQPTGNPDDYVFKDCGMIVDDSDPTYPEPAGVDKTYCFKSTGDWMAQATGYHQTSMYSDQFLATAKYFPDYKNLTGDKEIFATLPDIPSENGMVPATNVTYYVLTSLGVDEVQVTINQQDQIGKTVSLGKFSFDGSEAAVYLWGLQYEDSNKELNVIADAVCFGPCPSGNMDLTPPKITNARVTIPADGTLVVEANITDTGSGVAKAYVYLNGKLTQMTTNGGNLYAASLSYTSGQSLDYYILAYDKAGNEAIWNPSRGYISRGSFAATLGVPPWAFYMGKNGIGKSLPAAQAGSKICNQYCGDPINSANGNLYEEVNLLNISGRPDINLNIRYNSQGEGLSIFGESWTHNYNYHLVAMDNSVFQGAVVQLPDGRTITFTGANFDPAPGNYEKLTKTGNGYELTFKDLTKVFFDLDGDVTRVEDANANGVNFTYGKKAQFVNLSQIQSITADGGRQITFSYNAQGLVSQINAPEGKVIKFEYNSTDDLIKYIDGNNGATQYEYTDHNMTKKITPLGDVYFANVYDSQRRVIKQTSGTTFSQEYTYLADRTVVKDTEGNSATYVFNGDKLMTQLIDEKGNTSIYDYDNKKQVIKFTDAQGRVSEYKYDNNGNRIYDKDPFGYETNRTFDQTFNKPTSGTYRDADHKVQMDYDSHGNMTKITNAEGKIATLEYDSMGQLVKYVDFNGNPTQYKYTSFGDLESVTNALGQTQKFEYDGLGRKVKYITAMGHVTTYKYDLNDNPTEIDSPMNAVQKYEYDANNRRTKEIDPNGGTISYTYDSSQNLVSVINQLGFESKIEYGPMNEKTAEIDAEGRKTAYTYDPTYNVATITQAVGTSEEAKTVVAYNKTRQKKSLTDALGIVTLFEYDGVDRIIGVIQNASNSATDADHNVALSSQYNAGDITTKVTDANSNVTNYTVDKLDRVLTQVDAEGNTTSYEYDNEGNVTKVTNPNGNTTSYTYDAIGRLTAITDAKGGVTKFDYDADSNIVTQTDVNGVVTKFTYNDLDRPIKEIKNFIDGTASDDHTNVTTEYGYDLNGNVTSIKDPRGFTTTIKYDAANRKTDVIDARGNTTHFDYDKVNNLIKVTDKNGNATTQTYDNLNRVVQITNAENLTTKYEYDKDGNKIGYTDARNNKTTYEYNGVNRLSKVIDALNGVTSYSYDAVGNILNETDANGHVNSFGYDKVYRLINITDPENHSVQTAYDKNGNRVSTTDANGNVTKFTYDELDRLVQQTDALNGVTNYNYDKLNNILKITDANGHEKTYTYDSLYRLTQFTDAEGKVTSFSYDPDGNKVTMTDANDHATVYSYDEIDRLISQTDAENETTQIQYDNENHKLANIDPDNVVTSFTYDKIYRLINVIQNKKDGTSPSADTNVSTSYQYDGNGNLIKTSNGNNEATQFSYDALNRQIQEVDAEGNVWKYQYDPVGNKTVRVDADGHQTNYGYYADNTLQQINYFDGTSVNYGYDANNNRITMSDSIGSTTWKYDPLNRITDVTDALGRHLGYSYDAVNNRTSLTYNDGKVINYGYYKNDWLKTLTDPEQGVVTYSRDNVGMVTQVTNPNDTVSTMKYDKVNRVLDITNVQTVGAQKPNSTFAYTYNNVGESIKVDATYAWRKPSEVVTNYVYDPLRRLVKSSDDQNVYNNYTYDAVGNKLSYSTNDQSSSQAPFDSLTQTYSYNSINQLVDVVSDAEHAAGKGNNKNANQTRLDNIDQALYALKHEITSQRGKHITANSADNILMSLNTLIGDVETSSPNNGQINSAVQEITKEIKDARTSGGIDNDGTENSLLVKLDDVTAADKDTNGVMALQTTNYTYDANGNRMKQEYPGPQGPKVQGTDYTYDPENKLASALDYQENDQGNRVDRDISTMNYDGLGRRLAKTYDPKTGAGGAKRVEYVLDDRDPVTEYNMWNPQYENFYRGDQSRIASSQSIPDGTQGQRFWFAYDALGSIVGTTKQSGQSDHNYRYNDFGSIEPDNGNFTDPHDHYTYTGQEWDENMKMYEFYSRTYDPTIGSWSRQDDFRGGVFDPSSLNRYAYVEQNPINLVDSYGFSTCDPLLEVCTGGDTSGQIVINSSSTSSSGLSVSGNTSGFYVPGTTGSASQLVIPPTVPLDSTRMPYTGVNGTYWHGQIENNFNISELAYPNAITPKGTSVRIDLPVQTSPTTTQVGEIKPISWSIRPSAANDYMNTRIDALNSGYPGTTFSPLNFNNIGLQSGNIIRYPNGTAVRLTTNPEVPGMTFYEPGYQLFPGSTGFVTAESTAGRFVSVGGKVMFVVAVAGTGIDLYSNYQYDMQTYGHAGRNFTRSIGRQSGSWGGAAVGYLSCLGLASIGCPGVGTVVGLFGCTLVGGLTGSYIGENLAGNAYDAQHPNEVPQSPALQVLSPNTSSNIFMNQQQPVTRNGLTSFSSSPFSLNNISVGGNTNATLNTNYNTNTDFLYLNH